MYEFNLLSKSQKKLSPIKIITAHIIIIVSFVLISFSILIFHNMEQFFGLLKRNYRIIVYLKSGLIEDNIKSIQKEISSWSSVRECRFIPKDVALKELKDKLGMDQSIMEGIVGNPLPDSFEIRISSERWGIDEIGELKERLKSLNGVESVESNEEVLKKLYALIKTFDVVSMFAGGVLIFCLMILSLLMLYLFQNEGLVRKKFLFVGEAGIIGATGAGISLGIVFIIYVLLNRYVENYLKIIAEGFHLNFIPWQSCAIIIISGLILGLAGGLILSVISKR